MILFDINSLLVSFLEINYFLIKDEVAENIAICQDLMEDAIAANKL